MHNNEDGGSHMTKKIPSISRKDISTFLNIFPAKIIFINSAGKITYANESALGMLQYEKEDLRNHPFSELVEDKSSLSLLTTAWQRFDTMIEVPLSLKTKHHEIRKVILESKPFCGRNSKQRFNLCYIKDVTKLRATEDERDELHRRTIELLKKEAEANKAKDSFFSMMSHELRTPLTAIVGWTRLLVQRRLGPEDAANALETIYRNSQAQARLVDDLLEMARILSSKLILQNKVMDLNPLVSQIRDDFHHAIEKKQLNILVQEDSMAVNMLLGDEIKLRQVFHNLVANAIKFTPPGGTIEIRTERKNTLCEEWIEISVRDTGIGIKKEFLDHVFERFKQQDDTTTRTHGGLGLGLAIASHIVEAHGGTILVHSEGENRGAMFTVRLPLLPREDSSGLVYTVQAPYPTADYNLNGLNVLVVEDEKDTRDMLVSLLSVYGALVRDASGTDRALDILEDWKPDIILSDIGMPEKNGYVFIDLLKKRGNLIPVVALTAFVEDSDRDKALSRGFIGHVPKPIDNDLLLKKIVEVAKRYKPAGASC